MTEVLCFTHNGVTLREKTLEPFRLVMLERSKEDSALVARFPLRPVFDACD